MTALKKVTSVNHLPGEGNDRFPVYSKQFNKLVDDLTDGTADITANDVDVSGDLTVTGTTTLNGALVLGDAAADALTVNATATYSEPINYDNATTITAFATGGQASATALTAEINNITTVATAGDSVKLKAAVAGAHQYVKNSGATALDIFPASGDSIDALAVNLAIRIQPGSVVHFYAKSSDVWESSVDASLTLVAPTTNTGQLEFKATASAGNTVTTITNASQAGARTYTVLDAGASANFVMSEGAATINGAKTFGSPVLLPAGAAATPSISFTGQTDLGLYKASATELGITASGQFVGRASLAKGLEANYINGTNFVKVQGAPVNSDTDPAPVSTAGMLGGLLSATPGGAIAYTLPTGTQMAAAATWISSGESFDFSLINIGAGGAITVTAAADFTIVGDAVVAAATSALFRARYTGTNVWILYRIA